MILGNVLEEASFTAQITLPYIIHTIILAFFQSFSIALLRENPASTYDNNGDGYLSTKSDILSYLKKRAASRNHL